MRLRTRCIGMEPGRANWPRKVFGGAPGGFPPALAGAGLCHGSEAWELGARGRRELGQEPSRGCLEPPALLGAALQGRTWQGSQRKTAASARAHSTLPLSGGSGGGKPGWVRGGILCPAPTTDWPRLRKLAGEGSVAGGIRAASGPGTRGQSGSLLVARLSQEARVARAPLTSLPSTWLSLSDSRCPVGSGEQEEAAVTGKASCAQPCRADSRGGRPRAAPGGPCGWSKLWGPPAISTPGPRLLRDGYHKWGHQCTPKPPSSWTARACLSLTVLRSSRGGGGGGSAPGAGSRRRGQPGLRRPPSGLARLQITPLASGRCPRAPPPPAASARGQVHAGGAAVAASICSLHSHRPAPRRAPGRWSFGGLSY